MADVTIYTRQLCGFCTAAKRLLASKNVDFTEHDASYDQNLRAEMVKRSEGARTFPQIFVGDVHVGGCDDLMAAEKSGQLDELLAL
ncbi:MAG: glutaredoxin 3 [Pseudomonadota bacterium]